MLRLHIRGQGLAYRTEQTYIHWVKRFIYYHGKRHPKDMQAAEIEGFLSHLSINRGCSTNTQRIALNAQVYLYKRFMGLDIGHLQFHPERGQRRLPVIYSREDIAVILLQLRGVHLLMVALMYGTGLRDTTGDRLGLLVPTNEHRADLVF